MHHGEGQSLVPMQQGAVTQPINQFVPVRCGKYVIEIAAVLVPGIAVRKRQQMQVMIAQHGNRCISQRLYKAQHLH